MNRRWLDAEALDDLVLSAHSATAAEHETLTRIPGATLLGAAARLAYRALTPDEAWDAFHSGKVRFGDLRPLLDGRATVPMPRSWHVTKGAPVLCEGRLDAAALWDLSHEVQDAGDVRALRAGYVTACGQWVQPRLRSHTKSARDPVTRRARDGDLFTVQTVAAGTRFGGWLSWDDDIDHGVVQRLLDALTAQGAIGVGRSRAAEFGRLRVSEGQAKERQLPSPVPTPTDRVTVLLLSDLAPDHPEHGPTLRPTSELLGLPKGVLLPERCHVAARRYRPFNGYRRRPDLARTVLVAGSVLVFQLDEPLPAEESARLSAQAHGLHTQDGLGEVLVCPELMAAMHPTFRAPDAEAARTAAPASVGPESLDHPLARWALARSRARRAAAGAVARGDQLAEQALVLLERRFRDDQTAGGLEQWPPSSQWHALVEVAERARSRKELEDWLERVTAHGVARRQWELELWEPGRGATSLGRLVRGVATRADHTLDEQRAALSRLGRAMQRWLHVPDATREGRP